MTVSVWPFGATQSVLLVAIPFSLVLHPVHMEVDSDSLLIILDPVPVVALSICECQTPNAMTLVLFECAFVC